QRGSGLEARLVIFAVFREGVKRDSNTIQFFRAQPGLESGSDLGAQGVEDGFLIAATEFGKYDPKGGVFPVPAGDVRLSDRGRDDGDGFAEDVVPVAVLD